MSASTTQSIDPEQAAVSRTSSNPSLHLRSLSGSSTVQRDDQAATDDHEAGLKDQSVIKGVTLSQESAKHGVWDLRIAFKSPVMTKLHGI